ncbi:hypothetical protein [Streptomyces sp. WAC01280]|uniref:hypothetical protein n=1 Tax=Streptomyces sp. WAC01280 TaxID=2487424 RepID=UPI000F799959|nr:hypothetical protein [Streptomyces sp. WAC01280]RSS51420.1 hypothetical protein EF909_34575 [Streptomyces sp. WAC01280]
MNRNPRRILGAVAGAALLLGGAFTAQAVADSGAKPAPKVVTPADTAPQPASKPAVVKPGAAQPAAGEKGVPTTKSVPAENAPRVIAPGTGAKK